MALFSGMLINSELPVAVSRVSAGDGNISDLGPFFVKKSFISFACQEGILPPRLNSPVLRRLRRPGASLGLTVVVGVTVRPNLWLLNRTSSVLFKEKSRLWVQSVSLWCACP